MVALAFKHSVAVADLAGVALHFGEAHRHLAHLAQLRQAAGIKALAFGFHFFGQFPTRAVVSVESFRVFFAQPIELFIGGNPGVEARRMAEVVENPPRLVRDVFFFFFNHFAVFGRADAVAGQIFEKRAAGFFEIHFPSFFPRHHFVGQHVVHHHRHDGKQPRAAPKPFVYPHLHDGQVVFVLLEQEFDDFEAERHVAGFVGLGAEAKRHRGHVAVVRRARHKGHKQKIGQHVFKRKADGEQKFKRAGRARVFKERFGHREIPHAVVHMAPILKAVEKFVVMAHGVDLRLHMAQFVDRLHLAGNARADAAELPPHMGIALKSLIFERGYAGEENLDGVEIARVGNIHLAVVLGKCIENGIKLFLFFGLVFPISIHGEAEWVFPFRPIGDFDALEIFIRECLFALLIGKFPIQIAGEQAVFVFNIELGCHLCFLLCPAA